MKRLLLILTLVSIACGQTVSMAPTLTPAPTPSLALRITPLTAPEVIALPAPAVRTSSVTALRTVYIRPDPSTRNEPVGWLDHGDEIRIFDCDGSWRRVEGGWVYGRYLDAACPN
jgi:hypothetical protein